MIHFLKLQGLKSQGPILWGELPTSHPLMGFPRLRRGIAAITQRASGAILSGKARANSTLANLDRGSFPSGALFGGSLTHLGVDIELRRIPGVRVALAHAKGELESGADLSGLIEGLKGALIEKIRAEKGSPLLTERVAKLSLFGLNPEDVSVLEEIARDPKLDQKARWVAILIHHVLNPGHSLIYISYNEKEKRSPRTIANDPEDSISKNILRVTISPLNIRDLPRIEKEFELVAGKEDEVKSVARAFVNDLPYLVADERFFVI